MPYGNTIDLAKNMSAWMDNKEYPEIIRHMVLDIDKIYWNDAQRQRLHDFIESNIDEIEDDNNRRNINLYNTMLKMSIGDKMKSNPDEAIQFANKLHSTFRANLEMVCSNLEKMEYNGSVTAKNIQPEYLLKLVELFEVKMAERKLLLKQGSDNRKLNEDTAKIILKKGGDERSYPFYAYVDDEYLALSQTLAETIQKAQLIASQLNDNTTTICMIANALLQAGPNKFSMLKDKVLIDKFANVIAHHKSYNQNADMLSSTLIQWHGWNHSSFDIYRDRYTVSFTTVYINHNFVVSDMHDDNYDWVSSVVEQGDYNIANHLQCLFGEDTFLEVAIAAHLNHIGYDIIKPETTSNRNIRRNLTAHLIQFMRYDPALFKTFLGLLPKLDSSNYYLDQVVLNLVTEYRRKFDIASFLKQIPLALETVHKCMSKKPTPNERKSLHESIYVINCIEENMLRQRPLTELEKTSLAKSKDIIEQMIEFVAPRKKRSA